MAKSRLHELSVRGQSVWIDSLSRQWLRDGTIRKLIDEDAVVGVTSNPTIFQKALSEGDWYDEQLRELIQAEEDPREIFWQLAVADIKEACNVFRPIWDGGNGQDGYVSLEVDPDLAYELDATIEQALMLHEWVDKPNLFVKIPATEPGLGAIEECIARGKSINVTLIFSLARYEAVAEAYIRGLERLVESGGDPSRVASVASFFVSRVDTEADKRLDAVGHPELKGKLAIANAKLAYQRCKELFSGERWDTLAAKGATKQRCLWASTSTKNPEYRDVMYVEELIGPETVNTMPLETIQAFQDHGVVADTLEQGVGEARKLLEELAQAGVHYDDVTDTLEREGVQKFSDSFAELLEGISAKRGELVSA
ncbi:MAG TPA: transaldolase [Gaiellaceae bacterium]|nr:transaldolase [Gaiellaceae bacterium]